MDRLSRSRYNLHSKPRVNSARLLRTLAAGFLIVLAGPACAPERNTPEEVAREFLAALAEGSKSTIDTLVAWDKVLVAEGYIAWNIFSLYSDEEKAREIARYKQKFFEQDLPLLQKSNYSILSQRGIVVNRDDSDAFIRVFFKGNDGTKKQGREFETQLEMKFDPSRRMWVIVSFGDLIRINVIEGDYDPKRFYLDQPVR